MVGFRTFSVPLLHRVPMVPAYLHNSSALPHQSHARHVAVSTRETLAMNRNVAEAARRIFGNLPHSKGRSGNKVLRKNMIGHKIAEVRYSQYDTTAFLCLYLYEQADLPRGQARSLPLRLLAPGILVAQHSVTCCRHLLACFVLGKVKT